MATIDQTNNGPAVIAAPDPPPQADRLTADPKRLTLQNEFVAAGGVQMVAAMEAYYRSLPPFIDDISRDFGYDIYLRMMRDEAVASAVRTLINGVMSDGLTVRPGVDDKKDQYYADAAAEAKRCERELNDLPRSADEILRDLLMAMGVGNKAAEIVYRKDGKSLILDRLKVKSQQAIAYVVDGFNNVVGLLPRTPGGWTPGVVSYATADQLADMEILPREKFAILTWMPQDEDPRGTSLLSCVYRAWWEKIGVGIDYVKYLAQFASPFLIGILGKEAIDAFATDGLGNATGAAAGSMVQKLLNVLLRFMNGTAGAFPPGTEIKTLFAPTSGQAFLTALDRCDRRIAKGVTLQTLATQEGKFGTRAQAGVHQDTMQGGYLYPRLIASRVLSRDVLRGMVRYNRGETAAQRIAPFATLSGTEQVDKAAMIGAYANAYKAGFVKDSQLPPIMEELGLPPLTGEDLKQMAAEREKAAVQGGGLPGGGKAGETASGGKADETAAGGAKTPPIAAATDAAP